MSVIHLYILYTVRNSALERQSLGSSTGERIFNRPKVPWQKSLIHRWFSLINLLYSQFPSHPSFLPEKLFFLRKHGKQLANIHKSYWIMNYKSTMYMICIYSNYLYISYILSIYLYTYNICIIYIHTYRYTDPDTHVDYIYRVIFFLVIYPAKNPVGRSSVVFWASLLWPRCSSKCRRIG